MTTDTPRTDAALVDHMPECSEWSQHYLDLSTFARQIERELAASLENQCRAQAEAARLRDENKQLFSSLLRSIALTDKILEEMPPPFPFEWFVGLPEKASAIRESTHRITGRGREAEAPPD